jgi:hypothetical protein
MTYDIHLGFMSGSRARGVKPNRMGEAYPELQATVMAQPCRKFPDNSVKTR